MTEKLFDVNFFSGKKSELLDLLKGAISEEFSYVVTPNVNHIVRLSRSKPLKRAYDQSLFRICDSRIIYFFSKLVRYNIAEVITGSDLTENLLKISNDKAWSVTIVGAKPENIVVLQSRFPAIEFVHYSPPMGFIADENEISKCLDFVSQAKSQLYLFAVGSPQQEILAYRTKFLGGIRGVGFCIGASILFSSNELTRAPKLVQKLGLEWVFRILMEPRRLFLRYFLDGVCFVFIALKEWTRFIFAR